MLLMVLCSSYIHGSSNAYHSLPPTRCSPYENNPQSNYRFSSGAIVSERSYMSQLYPRVYISRNPLAPLQFKRLENSFRCMVIANIDQLPMPLRSISSSILFASGTICANGDTTSTFYYLDCFELHNESPMSILYCWCPLKRGT